MPPKLQTTKVATKTETKTETDGTVIKTITTTTTEKYSGLSRRIYLTVSLEVIKGTSIIYLQTVLLVQKYKSKRKKHLQELTPEVNELQKESA